MNNHICFFLIYLIFVFIQTGVAEIILNGKVIDKAGNPIEGAQIKLQSTNSIVTSWVDGTFELNTVAVKNHSIISKSNIRIHNGILSIQNTVLQNVILDIFNLNGQKICILQNGKLSPGLYQFHIPDRIGNQILLLRLRIGSINQVCKLIGNSNAILLNDHFGFTGKYKTADAVNDQIIVTHKDYDDVTIPISNYNDTVTVQMIHSKLSFEQLNEMKISDTLWNSSSQLKIIFDSLIDSRCCCSCICNDSGAIRLHLTLVSADIPNHIQFILPGTEDTTAGGFKLVLNKIKPACPPSSSNNDYQSYSVSFGIVSANYAQNILFLSYKKYTDMQTLSGTFNIPICLPGLTFIYGEDKILSGMVPKISDSSKIIYGSSEYIKVDGAEIGAANMLSNVSSLPFSSSIYSINSVSADGTLQISNEAQSFTLAIGEKKTTTVVSIDTMENFTSKATVTDSLINYGFLYPWQIRR